MKLYRYIDHDQQMTPTEFQVTRSKVKVKVTKNVFTQLLPQQLTAHMGGMHVLQTTLVCITALWRMFFCLQVTLLVQKAITYAH